MTSRIILHYGLNGTRKTSAALSDGCWHAELDAGSLERAWKEPDWAINSARFFAPVTNLLDRGKLSGSMMGQSGKGAVQFVHRYKGWDEKWVEFLTWFYQWKDSDATDLVIDTETKLWDLAQNAVRQRIQDEFPPEMVGDRLKRLEYAEPNSYMHGLIEEAKSAGKNLYFVAHEGSVWMGDDYRGTPIPKPDGWKEIQDEMDMVIRFTRDRDTHKAVATFEKCSGFEELIGQTVEAPTHKTINELLANAGKLRAAGKVIPGTPTQVLVEAAKLG